MPTVAVMIHLLQIECIIRGPEFLSSFIMSHKLSLLLSEALLWRKAFYRNRFSGNWSLFSWLWTLKNYAMNVGIFFLTIENGQCPISSVWSGEFPLLLCHMWCLYARHGTSVSPLAICQLSFLLPTGTHSPTDPTDGSFFFFFLRVFNSCFYKTVSLWDCY